MTFLYIAMMYFDYTYALFLFNNWELLTYGQI